MKRITMLLVVCAAIMCSCGGGKDGGETQREIVVSDSSALSQTVGSESVAANAVSFTTSGPWTSDISQTRSTANPEINWITVAPDHGDAAGDYTMEITLQPNDTGADRSADIKIFCGDDTITVSVTQRREGAPVDGKITLAEGTKLSQTVSAESTAGESPVRFTTTAAWSASIQAKEGVEGAASLAADLDENFWASITPDHGDAAGEYEIAITLQPSDWPTDRTAVLTITCGDDQVEIEITQQKKDNGWNPPTAGLIKKITFSYDEGGTMREGYTNFVYDSQDRVVEIHTGSEFDGEDVVFITYAPGKVMVKMESEWEGTESDPGEGGVEPLAASVSGKLIVEIVASLNADGYIESAVGNETYYYTDSEGAQKIWEQTETQYEGEYSDGFLSSLSIQEKTVGADPSAYDYQYGCLWNGGNMTQVDYHFEYVDAIGEKYSDQGTGTAEYGSGIKNTANLDLNRVIVSGEIFESLDETLLSVMGFWGKRSADLLSRTLEKFSVREDSVSYEYRTDNRGYVEEVTVTEDAMKEKVYTISYY